MEDSPASTDESAKGLSEDSGEFPKTFEFVTSKDAKAGKRARTHVMREYTRLKKRRQSLQQQPAMKPRSDDTRLATFPLPWRNTAGRQNLQVDSQTLEDESEGTEPSPSLPISSQLISMSGPRRSTWHGVSHPKTVLGAGRVDPFASFPVWGNSLQDALQDHCGYNLFLVKILHLFIKTLSEIPVFEKADPSKDCSTLGSWMYGLDSRAKFHPLRDFSFAQAMQDTAAFHACLAYSAHHLAAVGGQGPTPQALLQKARALKILNERLADPGLSCSDGTMQAVIFLAGLEDRWGTKLASTVHFDGVRRMTQMRGGLGALASSPRIETQIYWMEIASIEEIATGCIPSTTGMSSSKAPSTIHPDFTFPETDDDGPAANRSPEALYLRACCEEFITFFTNIRALAFSQRSFPASLECAVANSSIRGVVSSALRLGTPLQCLLAKPPEARAGLRAGSRVQQRCRLAVLLHIHVAIWDCRRSSPMVESFFSRLNDQLTENGLQRGGSIEMLLWILMKDALGAPPGKPRRTWRVGRLMLIAKRLSAENWEVVETTLLECIMPGAPEGYGYDTELDGELVRRDVLGDVA